MIDVNSTINAAKILADLYQYSGNTSWLNIGINGQSDYSNGLVIASYDDVLELLKIQEQSPLWNRYTSAENYATTQDFTTSYADVGSEIDCRGYKTVGLYVNFVVNDNSGSTNNLQILTKPYLDGSDEYVMETSSDYQKTLGTSDNKIVYFVDVEAVETLQIQVKTDETVSIYATITLDVIKQY